MHGGYPSSVEQYTLCEGRLARVNVCRDTNVSNLLHIQLANIRGGEGERGERGRGGEGERGRGERRRGGEGERGRGGEGERGRGGEGERKGRRDEKKEGQRKEEEGKGGRTGFG